MQFVKYNLASLLGDEIKIASGDESYVRRALSMDLSLEEYKFLSEKISYITASARF